MSGILWKALTVTLLAAVAVVWAFTLRPQTLGGPAMFVAVRGTSMLPTYQHGDLVVVESATRYKIGEVVAYRVPAGQVGEGKVVIHRIIGGDGVRGFTLKGDHNTAPDPWFPRQADMVGVATFRLPNAGRLIALVQQPVILAGLAAALVVTVFLARPPRPNRNQRRTRRRFKGLARGLVDG
ncbi:MAG: signal peptidase I [Chloroflexota bacterium]|nr:signal peptidase I [Chloroflexota bacterium]